MTSGVTPSFPDLRIGSSGPLVTSVGGAGADFEPIQNVRYLDPDSTVTPANGSIRAPYTDIADFIAEATGSGESWQLYLPAGVLPDFSIPDLLSGVNISFRGVDTEIDSVTIEPQAADNAISFDGCTVTELILEETFDRFYLTLENSSIIEASTTGQVSVGLLFRNTILGESGGPALNFGGGVVFDMWGGSINADVDLQGFSPDVELLGRFVGVNFIAGNVVVNYAAVLSSDIASATLTTFGGLGVIEFDPYSWQRFYLLGKLDTASDINMLPDVPAVGTIQITGAANSVGPGATADFTFTLLAGMPTIRSGSPITGVVNVGPGNVALSLVRLLRLTDTTVRATFANSSGGALNLANPTNIGISYLRSLTQ